jgi:large subunit ribosomal protein L25
MDIPQIEARPREVRGSRACRRLRRLGLVPATLYGRKKENVLLSVSRRDMDKLIQARAVIVQVNWDGQQDAAQITEIQYDAFGDQIEHVDFVRISLTEKVTVSVRVETHGQPAGVAAGGVLDLREHELEVECLPTAIPEKIRLEVSQLETGDALRVRDVQFPEGVTPTADPDLVVAAVVQPIEEEAEAAEEAPAEAIAEPEVIGRKEAEEEAEAAGEEEAK